MAANVTFDVLKEMVAQQERSFLCTVKMIISDVKDDLKAVKNDVAEFKQHKVNQVKTNSLILKEDLMDLRFKLKMKPHALKI